MAITILNTAEAVKSIYKNLDFNGFQLTRGFYDPKNQAVGMSGYSMGLYTSLAEPGNYILSIRGSAKGLTTKDWVDDDVSIALGRTPDRTNDALGYAADMKDVLGPAATIILAGHSLGGHMAQHIGVILQMPFVTFNAPPARGTFGGKLPDGTKVGGYRLGLNYRVNYDPVSKAPGKHVGPLVTLPLNGEKHQAAHIAAVVVKSVLASGFANCSALAEIARLN